MTNWMIKATFFSAAIPLVLGGEDAFVAAFRPSPKAGSFRRLSEASRYRSSLNTATTSSTFKQSSLDGDDGSFVGDGFLEDSNGHINPQLAQRIFRWEREQQLNVNLRSQFSTREGLRWVQDLVSRMATPTSSKADLIQEGVVELMQAMTSYETEARPTESFERFAKSRIQRGLEDYQVNSKLASSTDRRKSALSVESTVEITDPLETHYSNQDEWEKREGLVLDNGQKVKPDELVEDFLDETLQYEGEDQMWVHQQQVAAPLRDSIPENQDEVAFLGLFGTDYSDDHILSPDDAALRDMIIFNVDEFLCSTLDEIESQVIQLRFGLLDSDDPKTQKEVAYDLGITVNRVRKLQKEALGKLRNAYAKRYVNDEEDPHTHEDSV